MRDARFMVCSGFLLLAVGCSSAESGVGAGADQADARTGSPLDASSVQPVPDAAVTPTGEDCNGLDDDRDGTIDESCTCEVGATQSCHHEPAGTAGVGVCAWGTQQCAGDEFGTWSSCEGDVGPGPEVCNGSLDDDCDGAVDEGCGCTDGATKQCGSSVGECTPGVQTCVDGAWGQCTGGKGPMPEQCNGLDDDCDGVIDNGCPICRVVTHTWDYPDGCTLTTRTETAVAPADFWPGQPLYARLMRSYFDDCGTVGNLSLPHDGCAQGKDSDIPSPTDISSLHADQRSIPITITNLACYAYQASIDVRWCVQYVP